MIASRYIAHNVHDIMFMTEPEEVRERNEEWQIEGGKRTQRYSLFRAVKQTFID